MYVKIGKYKDWLSSTRFELWLEKKWNVSEKVTEKLGDIIQSVFNVCWNNLRSQDQNIKVKIDSHDTWNMEYTLAHIILPMLVQLNEKKHGAPFTDDGDVPKKLRSTQAKPWNKDIGEVDEFHHKRWDYILGEMIFAFEAIKDNFWEETFYFGEHDIYWEKTEIEDIDPITGKKVYPQEMKIGPDDTFKIDKKGFEKYSKRIDNGLRLFGKYYRKLWD
jgi:hypothetical protein|tara:strand:- start:1040 stop:1693 length:654 start_codon:yes stop_codon:yes gene_type:complete